MPLLNNSLPILLSLLLLCACTISKPLTPFEASQRYYEAGQVTEARRALETELANRPNNLVARYNLAVMLSQIGHSDEAQKLYEDNMKLGWNLPTVVNLSALYAKDGETDRARHLLLEATKHFPNEAIPWYLLAGMASRAMHYAMARQDFVAAIHADSKNGYAHIRYAHFLAARGDLTAALAQSNRAVSLLPEVAACWTIRGDILSQAGKLDSALIAYQKSAALKPDRSTRVRIIATLRKLGDDSRANGMERGLQLEKAMHEGEN